MYLAVVHVASPVVSLTSAVRTFSSKSENQKQAILKFFDCHYLVKNSAAIAL